MNENQSGLNTHITGGTQGVAGTNTGTVNITYISQTKSETEIHTRKLIEGSPYLGLEKFSVDDKDKFFGRDKWIIELTNYLAKENVLLLLGASGSGKSSLIQAGLIPKLKDQWGSQLFNFTFVPDVDPFESFYGCLLTKYKQSEAKLARTVKEDTLIQVVQTLKKDAQWLIFIDQFEEVFTRTPKTDRDIFIKSLIQLIENSDSSVKVIMTMRADFLDKLSPYPDLGKVHDSSSRMLTDMEDSDLRLAVAEPAARNGVIFEQGLIDTIIADFHQQAGSLPLLQYTLNLLWSKDDITDRVLNTKTYQELGGVTGALQQQANKIYDQFDETQRKLAEEIFLELIELVGKEAVSRRADKGIFERDETQKEVLYQLIDNRLLVSKGEEGKATVEVAHEALFRSWKVLQDLIREKEEIIILRNRLYADAKQWDEVRQQDAQKAIDELWGGSKLERILELKLDGTIQGLAELVERFIQTSVAWRDRTLREKQEQIEKLDRALTESQLREKAARVSNVLSTQPQEALIMAIETMGGNLDKMPDRILNPVQIILKEVIRNPVIKAFKMDWRYKGSLSFHPGGKIIVTTIMSDREDFRLILLDLEGDQIREYFRSHKDSINSVAFSPDGRMIASGSDDKTVCLWNLEGNLIKEPFEGHQEAVNSIAFSPDGTMLASGSDDRTVRLWNLEGNLIKEPFEGYQEAVNSIAFSPDGTMLASGSDDRTVRLWNLEGNLIKEPFEGHQEAVNSIAFSPDGAMLASGSSDGTLRLWDLQGNCIILIEKSNPVTELRERRVYDRDDDDEASGGRIEREANFVGNIPTSIDSVAFSPDGKLIVIKSVEGIELLGGHWQEWLKVCCGKLAQTEEEKRRVPQFYISAILKGFETISLLLTWVMILKQLNAPEKQACKTCQKYVWDSHIGADELYCKAKQKLAAKNYTTAAAIFTLAIQLNSDHIQSYRYRALAYYILKQYYRAFKDCDYILKINTNDADITYTRGRCYTKLDKPEQAQADYQQAITLYEQQGNLEQAQKIRQQL
jgi:sugar lactone lactonase YvrE/energy-coupling factor transporter ATP-binding protein EcfA2